jgi:CDP-paratose 2-epimerase
MKGLITGGAGFIGSNVANRFMLKGWNIVVLDNLSRRGAEKNLAWLQAQHPSRYSFVKADIRDQETLKQCVKAADVVFHFASQVAVTTSVQDPESDFETNARGTFNVLEACRQANPDAAIIFTSTNKVYGKLGRVPVEELETRYRFANSILAISEEENLDFYSPYGCSKGAADQYMIDYARIYGMKTVVFRMSCIYGTRQFGNEDQGWVAHFIISALLGKPIVIYGNGKQVRDLLFVDDLVQAFEKVVDNIEDCRGQAINIGGGVENSISLIELIKVLEKKIEIKVSLSFADFRPGDQLIYVSDTHKAERLLGWRPTVSVLDGVERLVKWSNDNIDHFVL